MTFNFVPLEAKRIDLSDVRDVERERLKVTFLEGQTLFFKVDLRSGLNGARLILDTENRFRVSIEDAMRLRNTAFNEFRDARLRRTRGQRFIDRLMSIDPSFQPRFKGKTIENLFEEFEVVVSTGNEYRASNLVIGEQLVLNAGTRYSNPWEYRVPWGTVVSAESIMLEPLSMQIAALVAIGR